MNNPLSRVLPVTLLLLGACAAPAYLQTAKTLPKGRVDVTVGSGFVHNEMYEERGWSVNNTPVQVGLRAGLSDQLEIGLTGFLGLGALLNAKYNFMPADHPLALSLFVGGGAATMFGEESAIHVPLSAMASYELAGRFTPYLGVGYGAWWFFRGGSAPAGVRYAERTGTGDGTLDLRAGLELKLTPQFSLLAEYWHSVPVVEDPGDQFALAENHMVAVGARF